MPTPVGGRPIFFLVPETFALFMGLCYQKGEPDERWHFRPGSNRNPDTLKGTRIMADCNHTPPAAAPCDSQSTDLEILAGKLGTLETKLCQLYETRGAMQCATRLIRQALHLGFAFRGDDFDPDLVFLDGYRVMERLAESAVDEIHEVERAFLNATKNDPVVGAALEAHHKMAPLGHVWTQEPYPEPE
jgi:hypothetical protein